MTTVSDLLRPEPKRDRWGRYLITDANDPDKPAKAHTRATTWAKTLEDTYNLEQWGNRMIALGMAKRPDLVMGAAACTPEDKQTLNQLCKQAKDAAGGGARAVVGTALHRVTQRVDMGEKFEIPDMFKKDVAAYLDLLASHNIKIIRDYIERVVVIPDLGVAGTFDRVVEYNGELLIADVKTGDGLDYAWLAIAIQLALYANASTIWDTVEEIHHPMPKVSPTEGLVFHVPAGAGTAELYKVDLSIGWTAALLCGQVRDLRNSKGLSSYVDLSPPHLALVPDIESRESILGGDSVDSEGSPAAPQVGRNTEASAPDPLVTDLSAPADTPAIDLSVTADSPETVLISEDPAPTTLEVSENSTPASPQGLETDVPALRAFVMKRLQAIKDVGGDALATVGGLWPDGLGTLKNKDDHTEAELDQIIAVLWDVENRFQLPFPDMDPRVEAEAFERIKARFPEEPESTVEVAVDDTPADPEACEGVIFALQQATPDVLAEVQKVCKAQGVPNLKSGKATTAHLTLVLDTLDSLEKGDMATASA